MARPSRYAPDTLPRPHHWMEDAACRGTDISVFFPVSRGGVSTEVETRYAKTFCNRCPVQPECLRHALTFREDYGVWGGLNEDERAELIRKARREAERRRRRQREKEKANAGAAA
ncbi:WhiB family transcriptional regulator [Streptomyces sioyaensis]|uniref:WhiB family transcriptional regulator n=1 Tax=Streptomyces sioyaensis TaxID=67364 RepID=UPI003D70DEA0